MAPLQINLTAFITCLCTADLNSRLSLSRTDSASSFASDSSTDANTEMNEWKYGHKRRSSEQVEVKRKRRELAEKRRRASDAAWREFWP